MIDTVLKFSSFGPECHDIAKVAYFLGARAMMDALTLAAGQEPEQARATLAGCRAEWHAFTVKTAERALALMEQQT
ncbi:hypothetical protein [Paraburkholderia adhaesiva]|uniref:hypothetical protein n=1 Tax=Paraburkholderia adhaesiva TaxID=2883244 RepID=UPI001F234402|nr:hypothetical protein [Paraburkholderia adhaesiva]